MDQQNILFQGELQLTAWGDSSTTGAWVKFWVHPEDLEHFKLLRVRKGSKEAGTRIAAVMVEIGDGEAVVRQGNPPAEPPRYQPPHVGALGMLAVRWCRDPNFWEWANSQDFERVTNEAEAKTFILGMSGLTQKHGKEASRKHLDSDPEAGRLFQERVRRPFMDFTRRHD